MRRHLLTIALLLSTALASQADSGSDNRGYYRFPALRGDLLIFTAEGDLWQTSLQGGSARRLTSHLGQETHAALSADGRHVAFSATYEGPREVYVMPLAGGLPRRLTWEGENAWVVGFTPEGEVLYATQYFSTLPQSQLAAIHPKTGEHRLIPLAQASQGFFYSEETAEGKGPTLVFTRFPFQGSYTKRYQGGTAQNLWRFTEGRQEAEPLTADFPGTSRDPMHWGDRIVFTSDRDGTLNLWSMSMQGADLRQHTHHTAWDVKSPTLDGDHVVYQLGADLRLHHLASGEDREIPITLPSDFDQRRERWLEKPMDYLTAAHVAPSGDRVVLTARGQVFVAPLKPGRFVEASRKDGVRYRGARFLNEEQLLVLSDESSEVEVWRLDARGVAPREQITSGGDVLRFEVIPSPDGQHVAFFDHDHELWVVDLEEGTPRLVATSPFFGFRGISWSPDSRFLAYGLPAANFFSQIWIYALEGRESTAVTSDRFESFDPAWSPDGRWLYFLSERNLVSMVQGPWGTYQPGPFLDRKTKVYQLALRSEDRSPFAAPDELADARETEKKNGQEKDGGEKQDNNDSPEVHIDMDGLAGRLFEVPVPPGNHGQLSITADRLYWLEAAVTREATVSLKTLKIDRDQPKAQIFLQGVSGYELSADGKKLLVRKGDALYVFDAGAKAGDLGNHRVPLGAWSFRFDPQEEWRQMFVDAWRLLRDYFYDPGMHGVDWPAMRDKYLPLVSRVTDRAELSDLFGELTGELSALHHYVYGGDLRDGEEDIYPASLGAQLERAEEDGGYRVSHIYRADPDLPQELAPLSRPGVGIEEGDVILSIDGVSTLAVDHPGRLLREKAGKQVLLEVADAETDTKRRVIVNPLDPSGLRELRYDAWEFSRRLQVEEMGEGKIGYVHLRAMTGRNYEEWARHYFPVFKRQGLIVDVRKNGGGNIDSWILGNLLRKPWMWWKPQAGDVYRNMQYAFGGHLVVLCDEYTRSDGEAFAEGFRRLGLGKVIGTRTWGGEIWLTSSNSLVDGGIATAAEFGVYGPEGVWLIEGHGVVPDFEVDNPPHQTFLGQDAQLAAAVEYLRGLIIQDPREIPPAPDYPDKSVSPGAQEP